MPTSDNPFEQLILPEQIPSAWPPAPVYWFITFTVIVLCALVIWGIKRRIKKNRITNQALLSLANLTQQKSVHFYQLNQLIKGLCLHYYSRETVASLNGESWFNFIEKHNASPEHPVFENKTLFCKRLYQHDSPCTERDFELVKAWIKNFSMQYKAQQNTTPINQKLTGSTHV